MVLEIAESWSEFGCILNTQVTKAVFYSLLGIAWLWVPTAGVLVWSHSPLCHPSTRSLFFSAIVSLTQKVRRTEGKRASMLVHFSAARLKRIIWTFLFLCNLSLRLFKCFHWLFSKLHVFAQLRAKICPAEINWSCTFSPTLAPLGKFTVFCFSSVSVRRTVPAFPHFGSLN